MDKDFTYTSYSSEDLLVIISFGADELEARNAAFSEFVLRYRTDLLRICEIKCGKFGNDTADAQDIVTNTFLRILKYQTFDRSKAKTTIINDAIFGWLIGILRAEFYKYYFPACKLDPEEELEIIYGIFQGEGAQFIDNKKYLGTQNISLINAINTLTEKEKIVFLTYSEYGKKGEYLPRKLCQSLCEELNLVTSSLRVYNSRAKEKLKEKIT